MTANQFNVLTLAQADFTQTYNNSHLIIALQSELKMLQAKVASYYHDEIVLRGDKVMMREYCGHFGLDPSI